MSERAAVRASYDTIAADYAANLGAELDGKPLDRALLDALAESAADGVIADVGAGPAHVARYLASRGSSVLATDLSPAMCAVGGQSGVATFASDMCKLALRSGTLSAIVCLYAVIHLDDPARSRAYVEFARVLRHGGQALISFHTADAETDRGGAKKSVQMMGHRVDLVFRFLDPEQEIQLLADAGLTLTARLDRAPYPGAEHPSQRSYLLVQRAG